MDQVIMYCCWYNYILYAALVKQFILNVLSILYCKETIAISCIRFVCYFQPLVHNCELSSTIVCHNVLSRALFPYHISVYLNVERRVAPVVMKR